MLQKEQLLKSAGSWHRVAHCPWCTAGMALTSCCVLLGALAAPPPAASSGKQPAQRMPDLSLERLNLGLGFPVQESLCCRPGIFFVFCLWPCARYAKTSLSPGYVKHRWHGSVMVPQPSAPRYYFFWFTSLIILSTCLFFQYASN